MVQVVVRRPDDGPSRSVEVFSRGGGETSWTLHCQGIVSEGPAAEGNRGRIDLESLKADLVPSDAAALYRALAEADIELGPAFRRVEAVWSGPGEAIGEARLGDDLDAGRLQAHPALLDGCFQILAAAAADGNRVGGITFLPFSWDRMWLSGPLPERVVCHVQIRAAGNWEESLVQHGINGEADPPKNGTSPEAFTADLRLFDPGGAAIGGVSGFTAKRATRSAMLAAMGGVDELLYEVVWMDRPMAGGMKAADFLNGPKEAVARARELESYLADEGIQPTGLDALQADLERLARAYALAGLERLGWRREAGARVVLSEVRRRLKVVADHERLLNRLFEMLAEAGLLEPVGDSSGQWVVVAGSGSSVPDQALADPKKLAGELLELHPRGRIELGLLTRCGAALADVLRGREDPLGLLFGGGSPDAADLYRDAPAMRAANRAVRDIVAAAAAELPEGRRLRVLEVGAGTGGTTAAVLDGMPAGQFAYVYTDVSAGFFAEAEDRFGQGNGSVKFQLLDIERDPSSQGFDLHAHDLVIAANVLHATRDLGESLKHCRKLLAPSGQLIALEGLRRQSWLDLTFGLLEGWWRFADPYRSDHALAGESVWRRALADSGFHEAAVFPAGEVGAGGPPSQGVIAARAPDAVAEPRGVWVLAADAGGQAERLAAELAARNQDVVLARLEGVAGREPIETEQVIEARVDPSGRESWRALLESVPADAPLAGIVHLMALDGHGSVSEADQLAADTERAVAGALALVQGAMDAKVAPSKGVSFVTQGAQVVERGPAGELAGATLWGFGSTVALEAEDLRPRMIDLDLHGSAWPGALADELMSPDGETQVAFRSGRRHAARVVRARSVPGRIRLPQGGGWHLGPGSGGSLEAQRDRSAEPPGLGPAEIRVMVAAIGLNSMLEQAQTELEGADSRAWRGFCGRVDAVGEDVQGIAVGDRVAGLACSPLATVVVTKAEFVATAPPGLTSAALAGVPVPFVTAAAGLEIAELAAGDRVLVHVGTDGVGQAAIQLAHAAGAEVFAIAPAGQHAALEALGASHVFDNVQGETAEEILAVTGGAGVETLFNASPHAVEESITCLQRDGKFVDTAAGEALGSQEDGAEPPDVKYHALALNRLAEDEPARVGAALRALMARMAEGPLQPLRCSPWSLVEAPAAIESVRSGRHPRQRRAYSSFPCRRAASRGRHFPGRRGPRRNRPLASRLAGGQGCPRDCSERAS